MRPSYIVLVCLFVLSGCTAATSAFEWSPLAKWTSEMLNDTEVEDVTVFYVTTQELGDDAVLYARDERQGYQLRIKLDVLEREAHVKSTWMGDTQCFAYKLAVSQESYDAYSQLQSGRSEVTFKLPQPTDGVSWLMQKESEILSAESQGAKLSLSEWVAQTL